MIERFECIRRGGRVFTHARCVVDRRIRAAPECAGCPVGEVHATNELARAWPDGSPVRWLGAQPDFEAESITAREIDTAAETITAAELEADAPRSEERSDPSPVVPPAGRADRSAPRAAEPESSHVAPSAAPTAPRGVGAEEGGASEPSAGLGARAAEPNAAERPSSEGSESAAAGGAGRALDQGSTGGTMEKKKVYEKPCVTCGKPFTSTGPSAKYCGDPCGPKKSAPKSNGVATTKDLTRQLREAAAKPARRAAIDPDVAMALDIFDRRIGEIETELAALETKRDKLCEAANTLALSYDLEAPYDLEGA